MLDVYFIFFGGVDELFDDEGVVAGAVGEGWALAEFDEAEFGGVDAWGIGGVGDIEADADVRFEAVGGHHGAVAADFFLDGVEADEGEGRFFAGGGDAGQDLCDDVGAEAVVEGAGDEAFVGEFGGAVLIDHGVADAEAHFGDFFGVGGSDIDPEVVDGGCFFAACFVAAEVDGGVADDSGDGAFIAEDVDAAATGGGGIGAADAVDAEEAFVIDVFDDVADFIGVGFEHDGFFGFAGEGGPSGSVGVALDGGGGFFEVVGPDVLAGHFEAGRRGGFEELEEEVFVCFFHGVI